MGRKANNMPKKKKKNKQDHPGLHKAKGLAGTGKRRKSEVRQRRRAGRDMHEQLVALHEKRKAKLEKLPPPKDGNGPNTAQSTAFGGKSFINEIAVSKPFANFFWRGDAPSEGEPELALKLQRKELGLKVRGASIPAPVSSFTDESLPSAFTYLI